MAYGLQQCLIPDSESRRTAVEDNIADVWGELTGTKSVLTCLSVRTALDIYLSTVSFAAGSEVIMSAVCIKDMAKVVQLHGLVPVVVDLHDENLQIQEDLLLRAFTSRTSLLIVSHIFGVVPPMNGAIAMAQQHSVPVFEDCAECFTGPAGYKGHPESDLTAFSFGTIKVSFLILDDYYFYLYATTLTIDFYVTFGCTIKTSTALGGCVVLCKDSDLRDSVVSKYEQYPTRPVTNIAGRIAKVRMLSSFLSDTIYTFDRRHFYFQYRLRFKYFTISMESSTPSCVQICTAHL
jgi:dTDP-4-amino-4,6-dideoxygalactose transaminase